MQAAGTLQGTRGETVTVVRASAKNCTNAAGQTVALTNNQPCVEAKGLRINAAAGGEAKDVVTLPHTAIPVAAATIELDYTPLWTTHAGASVFDTRSAANQNGIAVYIEGTVVTVQVAGSSAQSSAIGALTWVSGQVYRLRLTWGAGNVYLYRDGVLIASATAGTFLMPLAHERFALGGNFLSGYNCNCLIKNLRVLP